MKPTVASTNPRPLADIDRDRKAARAKAGDLLAEAETIAARAGNRQFTDGERERVARLTTGRDNALPQAEALDDEYRSALAAGLNDGSLIGVGPFILGDPNVRVGVGRESTTRSPRGSSRRATTRCSRSTPTGTSSTRRPPTGSTRSCGDRTRPPRRRTSPPSRTPTTSRRSQRCSATATPPRCT